MSKRKVPHYVRWRYAMDATPEIKGVEASPAALSDAKAVIDAQMEGSTPRNIGVDLDKDASIDEIVMKFFPGASPEDTETIVELLKKYKSQPVTVEVEDGEDVPLPVEETIKDETPDEQEKLDREHESEGMKKVMGDADGETYTKEEVDAMIEAVKKEMAAAIEAAKVKATDEAKEHYEGLTKAAEDCAPIVKIANPMGFKSSADIYRKALKLRGVAADSLPASALPAMVDFVKRNGGVSSRPVVAADSAPVMDGDADFVRSLEKRIKVL